jgi:hypothetical protein
MDRSKIRRLKVSKIRQSKPINTKKSKAPESPHTDDFFSTLDLRDYLISEASDPSSYIAELPAAIPPYTPFEKIEANEDNCVASSDTNGADLQRPKNLRPSGTDREIAATFEFVDFEAHPIVLDNYLHKLDSADSQPQTLPKEDAIRREFLPDLATDVKVSEQRNRTPILEQQQTSAQARNSSALIDDRDTRSSAPEKTTPDGQNPAWHPDFHKVIGQLYRLNRRYCTAHSDKDSRIIALEQELSIQKTRYEALSTLYQQLHDEHSNALSTVETLKREEGRASKTEYKPTSTLASMSNELEGKAEEGNHAMMCLTEERDKALHGRDSALAALRLSREAGETDTANKASEVGLVRAQEEDQQTLLSVSAESVSGVGRNYGSLSQPAARHLIVTNESLQHQLSVLSISSNRKVQMGPKSSFEDLNGI